MSGVQPTTTAPLTTHEAAALAAAGVATIGFGTYGVATAAPSTLAYVFTVSAVAVGVVWLRRRALPRSLAIGLAALATAHLAGGLVRVGDGVLYNASAGSPVLQYDHVVHASGVCLGTLAAWWLLLAELRAPRATLVLIAALAGLGMGAINETVEFVTTTVHDGSHVGGYENTGWDLISNVVGTALASVVIVRRR
jgi:hypothetical protein